MESNTNLLKIMGLDEHGDWLVSNKDELLESIDEFDKKLEEEISKKNEERETLRIMRDIINTTQ